MAFLVAEVMLDSALAAFEQIQLSSTPHPANCEYGFTDLASLTALNC
ncbi:hypothetical protein KBZ18_16000 [Synechococcus sp. Cruz-9H2]|nr:MULTISPECIES: hypothetical protein [unclassified Synechococcus]MCP9820983.1 hypothetical protein [Synechococcus sp. Cruz-9H2]MCP9845229.1 hypothetical protein [Synechococcus sp. Edmonson 11F2]MCP9857400.1 hypothetical protein [Synechococcus sp. Cruz-9C9]MCP9864645.1 hypothetical protein [Synechococcus sp. Cruz-7E5]MCP9871904.1 hypothetical protein [Synechococcus sp. Cruz-7B9]